MHPFFYEKKEEKKQFKEILITFKALVDIEGKSDFRRILNINIQTGTGFFSHANPDPTKKRLDPQPWNVPPN